MGVFSRFRRRKSEESTEETAAAVAPDGPEAEADVAEAAVADTATADDAAAGETDAPGGVEIPKQQSAGEAADSEAGEGARR
ncbi:hypothetical protein [Streptomyces sp. WAC06614]|uniref:hypothetical protein n=1 Tax=Streptomyces sp. WAC06614 TaxID=2487416 RepID=UPI000F7A9791|nr:hypothetical protein [Streptomyces sp. WAC06614]RSS74789.1 hypothetical protein EF918_24385 [Streptomyces sp. WAC06614]